MDPKPPKKRTCCVPGCNDKHSMRRRFPRRMDYNGLFNIWLRQINNPDLLTLPKQKVCYNYTVCDRHFAEECKIPNYNRLKPGSIPTLFLPSMDERTEALYNMMDASIDLPTDQTDSANTLIDSEELLNSETLELQTVEAQDSLLSSIFGSKQQYDEPQFPVRLPDNESTVNDDTTVIDTTNNEPEELEEFLYFEDLIDMGTTDIIKIEVEDIEEPAEIEEAGEVEAPLPEKPYFKSVKSFLVDSRTITEVCRICFRSILDEDMVKLYEEDQTEEANNMRNMLKLVLPDLDLEIYPNSVLCTRCHELLIYSYELKETWLQTEEKLQNILNKKKGVTNRDADLVIVAKAIPKDKIETKIAAKARKETLSLKDSTTNLVSDDHVDLDIENIPKKSNNVNDQKLCSNNSEIKQTKVTNKVVQDNSTHSDATTNLEVEQFANKSETNNVNNDSRNVSAKRIWGSEQQYGVDEKMLVEVNEKLKDILSRNDSDTNIERPSNNLNICNGVGAENDVEMKPAKVTNKVVQDILSYSDSTANLGVVIYHGDLDCEKSPRQYNRNPNKTYYRNPNPTNVRSKGMWGLGPYMCEVCGNIIPKLRALKRHLKTHANAKPKLRTKAEKNIMCELCGQLFANNRTLSMHMEKHGRKLDCTICHKVFKYSRALQLHVQRRHLRQYDYSQCHLCGKQLAYKKSLYMHLQAHTEERPHICNICDKRFFFACSLKKHLLKHTSNMLSCEHCGKALKYQHSLLKHIRIYHKNEAEFRCDFCSRPYWKKVDLIKHKIRIHGWAPESETS